MNVQSPSSKNKGKTVVIGMSGGVDSSVAALLLKEQGYDVIGLFMKNWEETDENGMCQSAKEFDDVIAVCDKIDIPYYSVNFVKEYKRDVFSHFLNEFEQGFTPNPDILCNREIKFNQLLKKAISLGADYLATGHYCASNLIDNKTHLLKAKDSSKDQSYFLYAIPPGSLEKVLFPLGNLLKSEVRAIARQMGLATSEKKDSTGICFIGERNFKSFLSQYIQYKPGNFETVDGKIIGKHDGAAFYTPGQRKGLGIGGPGEAWFVCGKDVKRNTVILAQGANHSALYCDELEAVELTWIAGPPNMSLPYRCRSKVRYRQPDQACTIQRIENGRAFISFDIPQRAVTLRQSIVFYDGDICLGGGMIDKVGLSYYAQNRPLPEVVSP